MILQNLLEPYSSHPHDTGHLNKGLSSGLLTIALDKTAAHPVFPNELGSRAVGRVLVILVEDSLPLGEGRGS